MSDNRNLNTIIEEPTLVFIIQKACRDLHGIVGDPTGNLDILWLESSHNPKTQTQEAVFRSPYK